MSAPVVVVGSGPVGTAYARALLDADPDLRVLLLEAGPAVTDPPGHHLANLTDPIRRAAAERACQGPAQDDAITRAASGIAHDASPDERAAALSRRPGLFRPGTATGGLPAALVTADVGGMGIHWLGACPRPAPAESPAGVGATDLDAALTRAETLLGVRSDQFADSSFARHLERTLAAAGARPMPLAVSRDPDGGAARHGTAALLASLAGETRFTLRPDSVCLQVLREDGRTTGVLVHDRVSARTYTVPTDAVVLACDALRTPQLLHASGIRPAALGRHLNEHVQVSMVAVVEHGGGIDERDCSGPPLGHAPARPSGITWLPYDPEHHPWHGMLSRVDPAGFGAGRASPPTGTALAALHLYLPQSVQWDNQVVFDDSERDWLGLPAMTIRHTLDDADRHRTAAAGRRVRELAATLGAAAPGERPVVLPAGSSLHFQGTVRAGAVDDGTSVCDSYGQVWGVPGLHVAGTGVIAGETAANPTLLAVALAVRGADRLVARRREQRAAMPT